MKRVTSIILAVMMVLLLPSYGLAEFVFRDGITWYISKDQVMKRLEKESDFENYQIEESEPGALAEIIPQEKENPQIWYLNVDNIYLGNENESVSLFLGGTKKTGLYVATYDIIPPRAIDENYYSRANELVAQLQKKYGNFSREDKWKNREKYKADTAVFEAWKELPDKTFVYLFIKRLEVGYRMSLEYQSPRMEEIEKSMQDGSFYIEPAFGL